MKRPILMLMLLAAVSPAPALAQLARPAVSAQLTRAPAAAPQSQPRLVDALAKAGNFTTFVKLWTLAGFDRAGPGGGPRGKAAPPITIFAPTDAAFAALGPQRLNALIADKAKLRTMLLAHVVQRPLLVSDMFDPVQASRKDFNNAAGWVLGFSCDGRHAGMHNPLINGKARVGAFQDVRTSDGIVHGIDALLAP